MAKKSSFHHGDLRQALLDASRALLDEHGPDGVTIRAVARTAGVSHAAPVNHFKDRKALLTAVATTLFDEFWALVQQSLSDDALRPFDRAAAFVMVVYDYAMAHPNRYRLLWHTGLVNHEDPELLAVMDQFYDGCCAAIKAADLAKDVDTDTYAVALWSMVHGYIDLRLTGMFEPKTDTISGEPRLKAMLHLIQVPGGVR